MKKLYLFDFDGTLTFRDTMFLFLKFYNRRKFLLQFLRHIPLFVLLKLGLAEAESVKKSFISSVLKGEKKRNLLDAAQIFHKKHSATLMRPAALDFIRSIDREHTDCYIVTASLDLWVRPFAEEFQMELLATRAEFKEGYFTGNFLGVNCNGDEKLLRIKAAVEGKTYDKRIAFGDTEGDRAMMNWADESYFRFFH